MATRADLTYLANHSAEGCGLPGPITVHRGVARLS